MQGGRNCNDLYSPEPPAPTGGSFFKREFTHFTIMEEMKMSASVLYLNPQKKAALDTGFAAAFGGTRPEGTGNR